MKLQRIVIYLIMIVSSAQAGESELEKRLSGDVTEQQLRLLGEQITTIQCQYQLRWNEKDIRQVELTWDIPGDRFFSTTNFERKNSDNLMVHVHVKNEKTQWFAVPENNKEMPGTWQVEVGTIENSLAAFAYNSNTGMQHLKETLTPYVYVDRRKQYFDNFLANGGTVTVKQKNKNSGIVTRTYSVQMNGHTQEEIVMELNLSDGIRILSAKQFLHSEDGMRLGYSAKYSDYKKIYGIWFPYTILSSTINPNGEMAEKYEFIFDKVEVNIPLSKEKFIYTPTYGSIVHDRGNEDLRYRVGQSDPTSLTVDNLLANSQLENTAGSPKPNIEKTDIPSQSVKTLEENDTSTTGENHTQSKHIDVVSKSNYTRLTIVLLVAAVITIFIVLYAISGRKKASIQK